MLMIKKIINFLFLDKVTMLMILESFFYLGWARILKSKNFSKVAESLGDYMDETSFNYQTSNKFIIKKVSEAINISSGYTLWESKCLVKAIAGMKMLERRKIESTLYLGTSKDSSANMVAHAWLRSGPFYISGKEEMKGFTIVGTFAKKFKDQKIEGD